MTLKEFFELNSTNGSTMVSINQDGHEIDRGTVGQLLMLIPVEVLKSPVVALIVDKYGTEITIAKAKN